MGSKQQKIWEGMKQILIELRNDAIVLHKIDVLPYLKRIQELEHSQDVAIIDKDRKLPDKFAMEWHGNIGFGTRLLSEDEIKGYDLAVKDYEGYTATIPLIEEE